MEVLRAADPERIAALRARDEFLWLDLDRHAAGGTAEQVEVHLHISGGFLVDETVGLVIPTVPAAACFWRRRRAWL
jgi:hypothetical protein